MTANSMASRTIWLIRHGATLFNESDGDSQERIRGWHDIPLSEKGEAEIPPLVNKLKNSGIEVVYTSKLTRAAQTADPIGQELDVPVLRTHGLRPWNVGQFTGVESDVAHPEMMYYATEAPDENIPEGESFNTFRDRAINGLKEILDATKGMTVAIVTHHRVERLLKAWIAAGQKPDNSIDMDVMFRHGERTANAERLTFKGKGWY